MMKATADGQRYWIEVVSLNLIPQTAQEGSAGPDLPLGPRIHWVVNRALDCTRSQALVAQVEEGEALIKGQRIVRLPIDALPRYALEMHCLYLCDDPAQPGWKEPSIMIKVQWPERWVAGGHYRLDIVLPVAGDPSRCAYGATCGETERGEEGIYGWRPEDLVEAEASRERCVDSEFANRPEEEKRARMEAMRRFYRELGGMQTDQLLPEELDVRRRMMSWVEKRFQERGVALAPPAEAKGKA